MKKESGILTVEATISLTAFLFFLLFFMNFGKVYIAQNLLAYGTYEAARAISVDNYVAEAEAATKVGALVASINEILQGKTELDNGDIFLFENGSIDSLVRKHFIRAIAVKGEEEANGYLEAVGIEKGVEGITFTCKYTKEEISIDATCNVQLMFPVITNVSSMKKESKGITITQHASSRLWKYVKEEPVNSGEIK